MQVLFAIGVNTEIKEITCAVMTTDPKLQEHIDKIDKNSLAKQVLAAFHNEVVAVANKMEKDAPKIFLPGN